MKENSFVSLESQQIQKKKKILNLFLNIAIAIMGVSSLFIKFFIIDGVLAFRAFTIDGNLFTTIVTIVAIVVNFTELRTGKEKGGRKMYFFLLSSAVTEAVIFIVVMIGYLPFFPDNPAITPYHMFCLHVGIPVLSVLRFIFFEKPIGILKPGRLQGCAVPIFVYGLGVTIAIKTGILPIELVPYSFLDFDGNFIWYFLFALFVIPSFGYLWAWMFYRLNIRASVLWFDRSDVDSLKRERISSLSRFDFVNSMILIVYCMGGLLILTCSLMLTSRTSTKIEHKALTYLTYYMLDDYDARIADGDWHMQDGVLYKGEIRVGDGTENNAGNLLLTEDSVMFGTSFAVKAEFLSPEIAGKYQPDDYVVVASSFGRIGQADEVGTVLDRSFTEGVLTSDDELSYEQASFEREIDHPLYESEYRKYFEEEKKIKEKYYHMGMTFGATMDDGDIGIVSMYIPTSLLTAEAKDAEFNADIAMTVIVIMLVIGLYFMTITWIKGLENSAEYLISLATDNIPEEELNLGRNKRLVVLASKVNEVRRVKICKTKEKQD